MTTQKADLAKTIQYLKTSSSDIYDDFKIKFLFHTNKIEGSTFSLEDVQILVQNNVVKGIHSWDDVIETKNSIDLFDYIIEDYKTPLTVCKLREYHQLLKQNTTEDNYGHVGVFKTIPNFILSVTGEKIRLAEPHEVQEKTENLLYQYSDEKMGLKEMAQFHFEFETIHPFLDGNGRIGRMLLLKQCMLNNIDFVYIHQNNVHDYRKSLYHAQTTSDIEPLVDVFKSAQQDFLKEFAEIEHIRVNYQKELEKWSQSVKKVEENNRNQGLSR